MRREEREGRDEGAGSLVTAAEMLVVSCVSIVSTERGSARLYNSFETIEDLILNVWAVPCFIHFYLN